MGNPGLLSILRALCLSLRHRGHEAYEGIPHCLLHGVFGAAIEGEPVDDGPDDDALLHEPLDGLDHVIVITAKTINPANNESVTTSEKVKQTLALLTFAKPGGNTTDPVVCDDVVILDGEASLTGLR
jgi:hypothetical protein